MELVSLYQNKIKRSWKIAFYVAFFGFLLVHFYKLTNTLLNHDAILNVYSNQDVTKSGRWLLQYACGISSYFDLPWVNGVLSAAYLGVTAAIVTELFDLENPVVIGLSALILAASPCTTETMFFGYTADGYFLGLMLCSAAAYFSARGNSWKQYFFSVVCLGCSLAIYQAYISFAMVLCICYMVNCLLADKVSVKDAWKWVGRHVLIYAAAGICYYGIWKLILMVTGQAAVAYQGIDQVGKLGLATLLGGAVKSVTNLLFFFLEWNILEHPITLYAVINILFILTFFGLFFGRILGAKLYQNLAKLGTLLLFMGAAIPAVSVWCFLSDGVSYRPMMLHSVCVLYIFGIILAESCTKTVVRSGFGLLMAVMVFNFGIMANIAYFLQTQCYEKSYYMGIRMMEDIAEAGDDTVEQIAFVGTRNTEAVTFDTEYADRIHVLSQCLEADLLFDHMHTYPFLNRTFDLAIPAATSDLRMALEDMELVQNMESWPNEGSVQVVDQILVIKLGEIP